MDDVSRDEPTVDCGTHGKGMPQGFVCRHVVDDSEPGWFDSGRAVLCPDAWCAACEGRLQAAGEWTPEAMKAADIKLVCAYCYHQLRGQRLGDELDLTSWPSLVSSAQARVKGLNDALRSNHEFFGKGDWHFELGDGTLDFKVDGHTVGRFRIAAIGSFSEASHTWVWAWANSSLPARVRAHSHAIRSWGARHQQDPMVRSELDVTLPVAWEHACAGAAVIGGVGMYRCPSQGLHLFFALLELLAI